MGSDRRTRLLAAGLAFALAAFLFVQPGSLRDESEHLHVAWLMAARGLRPLHGFFEHHLPMLWWVLSIGFRAGAGGPQSLYWARLLVIVCATVFCGAVLSLARSWSGGRRSSPLALAAFAATALFAPDVIVVRPETLALALLGASLWCWARRGAASAFVAGALFAGCAFASPRFVLFAPMFLLAAPGGMPAVAPLRRAVAALAGAAAVAAASLRWMVPWQELLFDVRFSAILQDVGIPPDVDMRYLAACILVPALLAAIAAAGAAVPRRAFAAWLGQGALLWILSALAAGSHPYPQAFAPALIWSTLVVAWLESLPRSEEALFERLRTIAMAALLAVAVALLGFAARSTFSMAALTTSREMLLETLPNGATVFLPAPYHPIAADDASYWGTILMIDSPNRLCATVDEYQRRYPSSPVRLPRCSLLAGLRARRPAAVYRDLAVVGPPDEYFEIQKEVETAYESDDRLGRAPTPTFSAYTLFRK